MLLQSVRYSLEELIVLLDQLKDEDYVKACEALSNATIGQHVRHILEMFKCLEEGYDLGVVNYDNRPNHLPLVGGLLLLIVVIDNTQIIPLFKTFEHL